MASVTVRGNKYITDSLYQWDLNQVLEVYGLSLAVVPEIHFTNSSMDKAYVVKTTMDNAGVIRADIPNVLLQTPQKIKAYVCIYEGLSFRSLYTLEIPIEARNKPTDYDVTEIEQNNIVELKLLIAELGNIAKSVRADADNGLFNGKSVSHTWEGTVLTIESASGKSSADLKGDNATVQIGTLDHFENLPELKIYYVSEEEYRELVDSGNLDEFALYVTPEQYVTAFNVNQIIEEALTKAKNSGEFTPAKGVDYFTTDEVVAVVRSVIDTINSEKLYSSSDHNHDSAYASNDHKHTTTDLGLKTETWTFTLEDGSPVTKAVYVG